MQHFSGMTGERSGGPTENPVVAPASDVLRKLFSPASVAFVGISSRPGVFQVGGRAAMDHLVRHGYRGAVYPISRTAAEIDGFTTYPSITDLPAAPDCVVIALPAPQVIDVAREALARGARAFILISSGFAEAGEAGALLQAELTAMLRQAGAVALGPNTTGFINFVDGVVLTSTSRAGGTLCALGRIGMVLQSGALGSALLDLAADRSIGLSHLISTGNEASADVSDCIRWLAEDPSTDVIALYLEGLRNPDGFVAACQLAARNGKSIVILKSGRSDEGSRAVASHTGALAGSAHVQQTLFRQLGVISVNSLHELLSVSALLAHGKPFGPRLGIFTVSGGLGSLLIDGFERVPAATFPQIAEATTAALRTDFPDLTACANPLDFGGAPFGGAAFRTEGMVARMLKAFASDPAVDAVIVGVTPMVESWAAEIVRAAIEADREIGKPVSVVWLGADANTAEIATLRQAGIGVFADVTECAASLGAVIGRPACTYEGRLGRRPASAGPVEVLNEHLSKVTLRRHGLTDFPNERLVAVDDPAVIRAAAAAVGYPVTLKGLMRGTAHKSELGLVAVGIEREEDLIAAAGRQKRSIEDAGGTFEGFVLVETVKPKAEILASVTIDELAGPVLTVGAGGIYTEILHDVSSRVLPVDKAEIEAMIGECRISRILEGARGGAPLDVPALVDFLHRLAGIGLTGDETIVSAEINPLAVFSRGQGVAALDAKVFVQRGGDHVS